MKEKIERRCEIGGHVFGGSREIAFGSENRSEYVGLKMSILLGGGREKI